MNTAKNTLKLDEKVKPLKFRKFGLFGLFRSSLSRKPLKIEEIRGHTAENSQYNSFKIRSKLEEK